MKIVFDGRTFLKKKAGINTFSYELLRHIVENWDNCSLTVIMPRQQHETFADLGHFKNLRIKVTAKWLCLFPNMLWYYFFSAYYVRKLSPDVYISPVPQYPFFLPKRTKMVIMVHDLVMKKFAKTMTFRNRMSSLLFDYSVLRAKNIWCNSEYTYQKVIEHYPSKKRANFFIGLTVSDIYRQITVSDSEKETIYKKYFTGETTNFILFVGSIEPRKNLGFLLKISKKVYKKTGIPILIIGSAKWKSEIDKSIDCKSVVIANNFVSDDELLILYNMASCYVSTSLNEGFGMPQLEAMKCGCPVVSPNNSAMTEVVNGYGVLIDGWDEDIWVDAISDSCKNSRMPIHSDKYDWNVLLSKLNSYLNKLL